MNKLFILLHVAVVTIFISIILGLSFGIVLPINLNIYNNIETICIRNNSIIEPYACCNKVCNNSLPLCDDLIKINVSGQCCNFTGCNKLDTCYIVCNNCTTVINTFEYETYITNVTIDCSNNQSCVTYNSDYNNISCWYNKQNVNKLVFYPPSHVQWYVYYIISVLCFCVIAYIIIMSISIGHYNLFI